MLLVSSNTKLDPDDGDTEFGTWVQHLTWWDLGTMQISGLSDKPWVFSWIIPATPPAPGIVGAGPAGGVAWNPKTHNVCIGGGLGASAGHNAALGPIWFSKGNIDDILSGWSVSGGGNLPVPTPQAGIGWQIMANSSGIAQGPTGGNAGLSLAVTWSKCAKLW